MLLSRKGEVTVQIPQKELPVIMKAMEDVHEQNLGVFIYKLARMKLVELIKESDRVRQRESRGWRSLFRKGPSKSVN